MYYETDDAWFDFRTSLLVVLCVQNLGILGETIYSYHIMQEKQKISQIQFTFFTFEEQLDLGAKYYSSLIH